MSKLLVEDQLRHESRRHGDTRVTAQARTLTVLSQLDNGNHKHRILRFLREARLISNKQLHILEGQPIYPSIVGLEDADLRGANLSGMELEDADLSGAELTDADLTDASLKNANLTGATLLGVKGLKKERLEQAIGDETTKVAKNLRPEAWRESGATGVLPT